MEHLGLWRWAFNVCAAVILTTPIVSGQSWIATYNSADNVSDIPAGLALDSSGNVYVTGLSMDRSLPENRADFAVVKYDSAGLVLWVNGILNVNRVCVQGIRNPIPPHVAAPAVDAEGNVYILGRTGGWECFEHPEGGADLRLRKLSPDNRVLLDIIYDKDIHASVPPVLQLGSDGSIYMAANSTRFSDVAPYPPLQEVEILVLKYDITGDLVWERRVLDTSEYASAVKPDVAMRIDSSGNVYVAGSQDLDSTNADVVLMKYDTHGNLLWQRRFNHEWSVAEPGIDQARLLELDSSNNIYVAGKSTAPWFCTNCRPPSVSLLLKYDSDGNLLWAMAPGIEEVSAMRLDKDGNTLLAGLQNLTPWGSDSCSAIDGDYVVQKLDSAGFPLWERLYDSGDSLYDQALALDVDAVGNVLVTGRVAGVSGPCWDPGSGFRYDMRMYDPDGNLLWSRNFAGLESLGADIPVSVRADSAGVVYVTGFSWDDSTAFDFVTLKYRPCKIGPEMFGDMTSDSMFTSADIIYLIAYIFNGGPAPPVCEIFGDANNDGPVTSADIIYMVNHIFKGGPPPVGGDPCDHPLVGTCP